MKCVVLSVALLGSLSALQAGRVVANNDEWTLSNTGFANAGGADAATFATNVATFLAGAGGNILIASSNFGLTENLFITALTSAGFTVTANGANPLPANLAPYNAIFVGGLPCAGNTAALTNFVNGGGGVYVAGGTSSCGGAAPQAAVWDPFLNTFGLDFAGTFNGLNGNIATTSAHPIMSGVQSLFYNNGNSVSLFGANPNASILEPGLIGIYDDRVPEPATMGMLGAALIGLALLRRKPQV